MAKAAHRTNLQTIGCVCAELETRRIARSAADANDAVTGGSTTMGSNQSHGMQTGAPRTPAQPNFADKRAAQQRVAEITAALEVLQETHHGAI
eukprot:393054-Amphidinium_carterae.1